MTPDSFSEFARLIPAPLLLVDAEGTVVRASPGVERFPPWPDGAPGRPLGDVVEDPGPDVDAYLRACQRSTQPTVGTLTFRPAGDAGEGTRCRCYGSSVASSTSDTRLVVLRLVPSVGSGERDAFAALSRQVEIQDSQKRKVVEQERQLEHLIETTQDAAVFIGERATITRFNAAAERVFGYRREEVIGQPVTMLMPDPHRSNHDEYIGRYERTGEARIMGTIRPVEGLRKDGQLVPIELSITHLSPDRKDGLYAAFIRDVSERERLQTELLEKERLAAIGTTSAMFAHEVGNPLNGMSMNVQLLTRRLAKTDVGDDRLTGYVARVADEIKRLTQLLDEFRGMSKRQIFRLAPIRLQDLLRQMCDEQAPLHHSRGIEMRSELPEDIPEVEVDRSKFKQVLLNLCKNAAEAMPDGGTLTVRLTVDGRVVRLALQDTGCGIPEGVDVFEPFATTKSTGTGLGLPVVRQMIAAHHGTIRYESVVGAGTTFIVELPVAGSPT